MKRSWRGWGQSYSYLQAFVFILCILIFFFSYIKDTHHEGDMTIYRLKLILILNLRTNTHERGGTRTRTPDLPTRGPGILIEFDQT